MKLKFICDLITLKYKIDCNLNLIKMWIWPALWCKIDLELWCDDENLTRHYVEFDPALWWIWPRIIMNLTQRYDEFDPALWCNFPENVPKMSEIFIYPKFDPNLTSICTDYYGYLYVKNKLFGFWLIPNSFRIN